MELITWVLPVISLESSDPLYSPFPFLRAHAMLGRSQGANFCRRFAFLFNGKLGFSPYRAAREERSGNPHLLLCVLRGVGQLCREGIKPAAEIIGIRT